MSNSVDLSKYTMSDSDRHQLESLRSEIESRIELTPVLEYLKLKEILTHDRIAQLKVRKLFIENYDQSIKG